MFRTIVIVILVLLITMIIYGMKQIKKNEIKLAEEGYDISKRIKSGKHIAGHPDLDESQKRAYKELTELCVLEKVNRIKIINFIDTLKDYDGDDEYDTTLNFVMEFLDDNNFNFIMRLDWKVDVETLKWKVSNALKENYSQINIDLPNENDYNDNTEFEYVFENFNEFLLTKGLQLGFIDTESDEYIFVLHKVSDKKKIEKNINIIGYKYYELSS